MKPNTSHAAASAACQGVWLSRLVGDIKRQEPENVRLLVGNKSAIALCNYLVYHDRSKHIDTRYHFLCECVESGRIEVEHISTEIQLTDIFTKALGRIRFVELRQKLGIINVKLEQQD